MINFASDPLTPTLSPLIDIFLKGKGSNLSYSAPFPLRLKNNIGGRAGVRGSLAPMEVLCTTKV